MKGVRKLKDGRWEARVTTGLRPTLGRYQTEDSANAVMKAYLMSKVLPYEKKPAGQFIWTGEPLPSLQKRGLRERLSAWFDREMARLKRR